MESSSEERLSWTGIENNTKIVGEVINQYQEELIECSVLQNGSSNINWSIKTKSGRYVLKCMNYCENENFIQYHNKLNEILSYEKYPSIPNISTRNNDSVLVYNKHFWQLHKFINGRKMELGNMNDIQESMKYLAKLHNISEFQEQQQPEFVYWENDNDSKLMELESIYNNYFDTYDVKKMIHHYYKLFDELYKSRNASSKFISTITHGDYHAGNILFDDNNNINAIIDWDTSRVGPRIYDFSKSAYLLCRKQHNSFQMDYNLLKFCMEYYNKNCKYKLKSEELEVIPLVLAVNYIPKPEYIRSFGVNTKKICWYLDWTYRASHEVSAIVPFLRNISVI